MTTQMHGYYSKPLEISSSVLAAMKGYFVNRGFGETSAESIAITIITQSKQDGYNPMLILDTLRGLNNVELSGVVSEILNYNRFKTSSLGYANISKPNIEVNRWIIDDGKIRARQTTIFYSLTDENNDYLLDENSEILTTD
jgi:hypothetical protein